MISKSTWHTKTVDINIIFGHVHNLHTSINSLGFDTLHNAIKVVQTSDLLDVLVIIIIITTTITKFLNIHSLQCFETVGWTTKGHPASNKLDVGMLAVTI